MSKETCCLYRRKILVSISAVLPEQVCGVPDSHLADLLRFDMEVPTGHPVLAFRYCPWCGTARDLDGETRITDATDPPPKAEESYAKCTVCERGFEVVGGRTVCPDCADQ